MRQVVSLQVEPFRSNKEHALEVETVHMQGLSEIVHVQTGSHQPDDHLHVGEDFHM